MLFFIFIYLLVYVLSQLLRACYHSDKHNTWSILEISSTLISSILSVTLGSAEEQTTEILLILLYLFNLPFQAEVGSMRSISSISVFHQNNNRPKGGVVPGAEWHDKQ